jgi:SAM-dependent methyltransferase
MSIATDQKETRVSMEQILPVVMRLQAAAEALAALGARAGAAPGEIPENVAAAIDDVLTAAGIPPLDDLAPPQRAMLAGLTRTLFGQAANLLHEPARDAGWTYTDPTVLDGMGRGSMMVPGLLAQSGELGDVTSFLDIGTGVGLLAVAAAQTWPGCSVVGIDLWEPSLDRARQNIADARLADRVEIRKQDVTMLDDTDRYDLTWLPSFFLTGDQISTALERILSATVTGGAIAVGLYNPPPDSLALATQRLRTLRDGGVSLTVAGAIDHLGAAGWADAHQLPASGPSPLAFVIAFRSAARLQPGGGAGR